MIGTVKELIPQMLDLDQNKKFELKEHKKIRSKSQNNYAWELMEKMAKVLRTSKDEVYEIMLQRYGTLLKIDDEIVTIARKKELQSSADLHIKFMGKREVNNNLLNTYAVIKGSSQYDTKEMSIFIDGVISEAKELDIETLTPEELSKMRSLEEERGKK